MIRRHFVGLTVPLLVMGILFFYGLGTAAVSYTHLTLPTT